MELVLVQSNKSSAHAGSGTDVGRIEQADRRRSGPDDAAGAGFDFMIEAARTIAVAGPAAFGGASVSNKAELFSEMFEPRLDNPLQQRQAELKPDYHSEGNQPVGRDHQTHADGRAASDPSAAPHVNANTPGGATASPAHARQNEGLFPFTSALANSSSETDFKVTAPPFSREIPHDRAFEPGAPGQRMTTGNGQQATGDRQQATVTASSAVQRLGGVQAGVATRPAGVASASSAARVGDSAMVQPAGTAAHQVGELLAGKGGNPTEHPPGSATVRGENGGSASVENASPGEKSGGVFHSTLDSLVRSIRLGTAARHTSARLQLHPPELGRIDVDVRVSGESIRVQVRAETDVARGLLASRVPEVTAALQQHGIAVERFDVLADGFANLSGFSATTGDPGFRSDDPLGTAQMDSREIAAGERSDQQSIEIPGSVPAEWNRHTNALVDIRI